jgi:hypothetical protein
MMGWWDGKRKVEIKGAMGGRWRNGEMVEGEMKTMRHGQMKKKHHRKKPKSGPRWE